MENKNTNYNKQNNVSAISLSSQETLIINPQIVHTRLTDSDGEHHGPDELIIVFSAVDPIPIEEREALDIDPNVPLIISLESKSQVDHLIAVLQQLRVQLYGMDLSFDKIKN